MEFVSVFHILPLTSETAQVNMLLPDIPKRMNRDKKSEFFQSIMVQRQLDLFGLTWEQVKELEKGDPEWFKKGYLLTEKQYDDLKKVGITLIGKLFKVPRQMCEKEWSWWALNNTLSVNFNR
jgi:hypothetical protein